jgi:hypothetical protein
MSLAPTPTGTIVLEGGATGRGQWHWEGGATGGRVWATGGARERERERERERGRRHEREWVTREELYF